MENEEIKKNLSYLNNFLGYGDSNKAKVFHIAIEEKLKPDYNREEVLRNFYTQRDYGEDELIVYSKTHSSTEETQSKLSYRILNEILEINLHYSLDQYLSKDNEILRFYEFGGNVNPIWDIEENNGWPPINIEITGYDNKNEFLNDSWNGTGKFEGRTSRKEKMTKFFNKLKNRMDQEEAIYIFIEGNSPYDKLKEIINTVFEIDCESESDRINHLSHRGNNIYSFYGNKIWSIAHPSHGHFNDTDIDKIINYLKP